MSIYTTPSRVLSPEAREKRQTGEKPVLRLDVFSPQDQCEGPVWCYVSQQDRTMSPEKSATLCSWQCSNTVDLNPALEPEIAVVKMQPSGPHHRTKWNQKPCLEGPEFYISHHAPQVRYAQLSWRNTGL